MIKLMLRRRFLPFYWQCRARYLKILCLNLLLSCLIYFLYLQWLRIESIERLYAMTKGKVSILNEKLANLPSSNETDDVLVEPRIDYVRLFSAYLDARPEVVHDEVPNAGYPGSAWALIRIVAIVPVSMVGEPLTCYYNFTDARRTTHHQQKPFVITKDESLGVRLVAVGENFDMPYSAAFVLCQLRLPRDPNDPIALPHSVTVSSNGERRFQDLTREEFVRVRYPQNGFTTTDGNSSSDRFMAVCVQDLHHQFDKHLELITFVEFYKLMGVTRFTFYNTSVTPKVDEVLNHYKDQGVAVVLDWKLPSHLKFERTIRVNGIFAVLNDCLYRSAMFAGYKYVASVDVDEFIVPRQHSDYREMMSFLDPAESTKGSFILRNMFFYLIHDDDPITLEPGNPKLNLHGKTSRWRVVNPKYDRSKLIVRGANVVEMGNHRTWSLRRKPCCSMFSKRFEEVIVEPEVAGSHHYRYCETTEDTCWRRPTVTDRSAHRFSRAVAARVARVCQLLFGNYNCS